MGAPTYITQLRAADLEKMIAAGNARGANGIVVKKVGDTLEISLDDNRIKEMIWCYVQAGGITTTTGVGTQNLYAASALRQHIKMQPGDYR